MEHEVFTAFDNVKNVERPIVTRVQARAQGLPRYFTDNPCPKGHITERNVNDGGCTECKRLRRLIANMTPEQAESYRARARVVNMTPEKRERVLQQSRDTRARARAAAKCAATVEGKQP